MTFGTYLFGCVALAVSLAAVAFAAVRVRRALIPDVNGALARLAEIALGGSLLIVVLQLFGAIGLFSRAFVVVGVPAFALVIGLIASRFSRSAPVPRDVDAEPSPDRSTKHRVLVGVALGLTVLVAAQWVAHADTALHGGMRDLDSLRYHGPFAARWVQQHSVVHLQYTSTENQEFFFPGNSELLDAWSILLFARDLLTPLRNLLWLGVAFLAAWCAGKRIGSSAAALAGVAAVCSTPLLASIEPGSAKNDIVAIAWVLSATALLIHGLPTRDRPADLRLFLVAGLAAGCAAGTKLTVLGLVGVMFVAALVVAGRRAAPRAALAFGLPALCTGGLWYARNAVYTGTPLPWFHLHLGPISLAGPDMPVNREDGFTVLHYLGDHSFWSHYAFTGLAKQFGPLYPVTLLGVLGVALYAVFGRDGDDENPNARRVVGVTVLAALIAYLVTPWSAGGPLGTPHLFGLDLRFMTPALALGAVAAARTRLATFVVGIATVIVVFDQFSARGKWPTSVAESVLATAALVGVPVAVYYATRRTRPAASGGRSVAVTATVAVVVIGLGLWGWPVQREAMRSWYSVDNTDLTAAYKLFHDVRNARVAVGGFADDYPLYGVALTNRVQLLGDATHNGGFRGPSTCTDWMQQLRDGHYNYVVLGVSPAALLPSLPPATIWTARDPNAQLLFEHGMTAVFKLNGVPDPAMCAPTRS
jgi:hypothetical protein